MNKSKKLLKEQIKERLKAQAGLYWPNDPTTRQDSALSFDPLVDLLFGAFASELERIYDKIETVESRVIEKTLEMIIPDVVNRPFPAYSVVNILPRMNEWKIERNETLLEIWDSNLKRTFHFTPSGTFKTVKGKIKLVAFSTIIYEYATPMERRPLLIREGQVNKLPDKQIWIGMQLPSDIESFERVCLYIDWKSHKNRGEIFKHLYELQIFHENQILPFKVGVKDYTATNELSNDWGRQYEKSVQQILGKHFLSIEPSAVTIHPQKYPKEWETLLPPEQLKSLTEPLVWLKVAFPTVFNRETFEDMIVAINCFPVLNRYIRGKREFRKINDYFNVFPLKFDDGEQFIDIHTITATNGELLKRADELKPGDIHCFVLRKGGVARFDKRDALDSIHKITNLFRDEASAFIAIGEENESELLKQIKTVLDILQNKIPKLLPGNSQEIKPNPYVCVQTVEGTNIEIQYWLTEGADANKIEMSSLLSTSDPGIDTITLMQPISGGRDPLSPTSQIFAAKQALLTRNQIVTHADLKIAILNEYGGLVNDVKIQKQSAQLMGQKKSIKPELMIKLCFTSVNRPAKAVMEDVRSGILRMIEEQSSIPINSLFDIGIQWVES